MVIGLYVGVATVGIFVYYYTLDVDAPDQHTLVSLEQLMSWGHCDTWSGFSVSNVIPGVDLAADPCRYFRGAGKVKASTLSLTVLVIIEMLNALNALSEDGSLYHIPPWRNWYLIFAIMGSVLVHFTILYIPILAQIFAVAPLDVHDWTLVMYFSIPVILIDEILKFFGRITTVDNRQKRQILKKAE